MEVLIAALILNILGKICKKIKFIPNNYIPIILGVVGVVGFMVYYWGSPMNWELIFKSGLGAASASVFLHQVVKQILDKLNVDKGTQEMILEVVNKLEEDARNDS